MKLFYYQFTCGVDNFGDNLNVWLWDRLLDGYLDDDERSRFIGIGTLLNDIDAAAFADAQLRVVFSTGVGYGEPIKLDDSWQVYCVRGPLSAQALGLPESLAASDGAMMVALTDLPKPAKRYRYSFMPHIEQIADQAWRKVCHEIGFGYIDPRWPVQTVLTAIAETDVVIAEAMHGAIVADALRVPWIPVASSARILSFKWRDWCASVGLEYKPYKITTQVNPRPVSDLLTPVRRVRYWAKQQAAQIELARLKHVRPQLSSDADFDRVVGGLASHLDRFKADVDAGKLRLPDEDVELNSSRSRSAE